MDKQQKIETVQRILATGPLPDVARAAASVLIEDTGVGSGFFPEAGRCLLGAVITALMLNAPETWTMADVAATTQDWERTKELLSSQPATARMVEEFSIVGDSERHGVLHTVNLSLHSLRDMLYALPVRPGTATTGTAL
jgi:hypothetical protein